VLPRALARCPLGDLKPRFSMIGRCLEPDFIDSVYELTRQEWVNRVPMNGIHKTNDRAIMGS
jgi:hypothetical protein